MATAPYQYDLATCVGEVDIESWHQVCGSSDNPYLDLRFLRAVEISFAKEASFWYLIARDESGRPVDL